MKRGKKYFAPFFANPQRTTVFHMTDEVSKKKGRKERRKIYCKKINKWGSSIALFSRIRERLERDVSVRRPLMIRKLL